ncbi:MAG: non-canonical purine NTP pyrophosphatase, partial [Longimicrobiales bacterium]
MTSPHRQSILLASRSRDKAREIREILTPILHLDIVTLDDAAIVPDPAESRIEAYDTFLGNAHAKADYFLRLTRRATIADDSGISVDALEGAPGVRSRRFAQESSVAGFDQDRANNEQLLRQLQGTPGPQRTAQYTCAAVLHLPDGRRFSAIGTCSGLILPRPRGDGGFGYDPLFLIPELGLTFGEVSRETKHRRSHRARAFRALASAVPAAALAAAGRLDEP